MQQKNHKNWILIFNELKEFYITHGKFPSKSESQKLYTWCAVQRLKKKKDSLTEEKIQYLESIHFIWDVQNYTWNKNFEMLLDYRKANKQRWPSQRSSEAIEHKLAVWFLGIRKDYKNSTLSKDRIAKLSSINFPFYPREHRWENTFNEVKSWMTRHKKFPTRNSVDTTEQKLFNWCRYQAIKREYEMLEAGQVKKLEEINISGFIKYFKEVEQSKLRSRVS